jgi:hypothetical protein
MSFSLETLFSRKNINLIVGLITLLLFLWIVLFAIPSLFVNLFDTFLGNLILILFILFATIYDKNLGIGLAVVFIILWRFSHMSSEPFIL